ncbi:E3 ubiquitin-protein ligase BOI [Raphanus sativus]|uniref:E3 ubiquitin-protein ligase BOI n=1 Tax=Raphanus sativus TaxID=3726 RepID=A0A6J0NBG0_RAPSA|nr:E3 ubiquitin-protein ligase BOI [Raphanus sativus]KAJ4899871.1 E3 ubiquitin-protein ligase BOI [Raphanus sativus]
MAVEAHHMNIFSPQLLSNRDCVKFEQDMNHGGVPFVTGESLAVDPLAKARFNKSESGLTYKFNSSSVLPPSAKRARESQYLGSDAQFASPVKRRSGAFGLASSLINAELVFQIQNQQQSEIDRYVAQQTEKLRIEVETRQRTQTRILASTFQNAIAKKLKEKDDEIVRMRNLNWILQERVKSLYVENQIWRDMAQTNEAHANNLRTNLDQVLAQVQTLPTAPTVVEDDAESSCGSCVEGGEGIKAVGASCKLCGEREASVLVLPCRHLCLCTVCGSALLQTCPVCDSVMNASVHVNISP